MSEADATTAAEQDLAAAIHETTNALTVILGWVERARDANSSAAESAYALERAERYARAARDQMRRAIGAEVPAAAPEPVTSLLRRLQEDLDGEAQRRQILLRCDLGDTLQHCVVTRPHAVWQILTNLLFNALALSPAGSEVQLSAAALADNPSRVQFIVSDQGPGVAEALRDNLFSGGGSLRDGGAGIGLRHAHALALELGGELQLLSDRGSGADFALSWPCRHTVPANAAGMPATVAQRAEPAAPPALASESASPSPHLSPDAAATAHPNAGANPASKRPSSGLEGTRVLLLEDDEAITELLELSLGARGASVTSVNTAKALYRALEQNAPDVVLMDLSPLEGNLDEALQRAREQNPAVSCIVVSGSVTEQPREDIMWVRKPFEPRELIAAIARERGGAGDKNVGE